jgi:hypothetical protein
VVPKRSPQYAVEGLEEAQLNPRHFTRLVCPESGSGEHAGWAEGTFTQTEISVTSVPEQTAAGNDG